MSHRRRGACRVWRRSGSRRLLLGTFPDQPRTTPLDVTIKPRSSLRSVTLQLNRGGVPVEPELFVLMTRLLGLQGQLKSGNYEFRSGVSPYDVLQKLALGDVNESMANDHRGLDLPGACARNWTPTRR